MVVKKRLWQVLLLGALSAGGASCQVLPDILPLPKQIFTPTERKAEPRQQQRQVSACRPVGNKEVVYVVRKNDTLGEIAQCFKIGWHLIANRNKLKNPNRIAVGQRLVIPARTGRAAASSRRTGSKSASAPVRAPTRAKSGINWTWPAKGKIIRKFSSRSSGKQGITIAGKTGQKIISAASGKVVYSGEGLVGYGKLVIVQHPNEFLTAYAHNDRLLVKEGQPVKRGQTIAQMGKTAAESPRLHFEMRYRGKAIDPMKYLP